MAEAIVTIRWPLVAFDDNLYPYLIEASDLEEDRFETILAEEVVAAFDRHFLPVRLRISRSGKHVIAEVGGHTPDLGAWSETCRASLLTAWPERDVAKMGKEAIGLAGPEGLRELILLLT
ncbi:hypothetical protein [Curtobacterium sp. Leaf261]|uniref:hypothetical protein n=1 Tax=Curtobacterium sp. Leaf261 TaxID=1736311 RepID=UPI000AF49014|nr:hypothetical protein [Curtobacterium sp. Leaf261]